MKNRRKSLYALIAIIAVLFMVNPRTIEYIKTKTGFGEKEMSAVKEIDISHNSQTVYEKFNGGLIKHRDGILTYYDTGGEQIWNINSKADRPMIKTNSENIYIADKNRILCINKKGEQVYKIALDGDCENFNICDDNYVILHQNTENPIQHITVINEKGEKISEITLGEGKTTNMAVSKIYDRIAISTIDTDKDNLKNTIITYDLDANLLSSKNFEDNIILDIFYDEKGNLIVVDEKNISSINKDNLVNWQTDFDDPIAIMDTKNKGFITIYNEHSNRNSIISSPTENTIKLLSYDGKLLGETKQNEKIIDMDSYKNGVIACSLRTVFKYDKNGKPEIEHPYVSDILKCFVLSDDNMVIITKEKIRFLSSKRR